MDNLIKLFNEQLKKSSTLKNEASYKWNNINGIINYVGNSNITNYLNIPEWNKTIIKTLLMLRKYKYQFIEKDSKNLLRQLVSGKSKSILSTRYTENQLNFIKDILIIICKHTLNKKEVNKLIDASSTEYSSINEYWIELIFKQGYVFDKIQEGKLFELYFPLDTYLIYKKPNLDELNELLAQVNCIKYDKNVLNYIKENKIIPNKTTLTNILSNRKLTLGKLL